MNSNPESRPAPADVQGEAPRKRSNPGFVQIHRGPIQADKLKPLHRLVYFELLRDIRPFAQTIQVEERGAPVNTRSRREITIPYGAAFRSDAWIAEKAGVSVGRAREIKRSLARAGLIAAEHENGHGLQRQLLHVLNANVILKGLSDDGKHAVPGGDHEQPDAEAMTYGDTSTEIPGGAKNPRWSDKKSPVESATEPVDPAVGCGDRSIEIPGGGSDFPHPVRQSSRAADAGSFAGAKRETENRQATQTPNGHGRTDGGLRRRRGAEAEQGEEVKQSGYSFPFPASVAGTPQPNPPAQAEDRLQVHTTDESGQPVSPNALAIRAANVEKVRRMRTRWNAESDATWTELEGVRVVAEPLRDGVNPNIPDEMLDRIVTGFGFDGSRLSRPEKIAALQARYRLSDVAVGAPEDILERVAIREDAGLSLAEAEVLTAAEQANDNGHQVEAVA